MSLYEASRFIVDLTRGLPHAQRLLMLAIVAKWDAETQRSGVQCRHSYQSLREWLEVEGSRGRPGAGYSKRQIRHFLLMLERRGLIVQEGDLVFKVPALAQDNSVQRRSVTTYVTNYVTPTADESRSTVRKNNGEPAELRHDLGHDVRHTSTDDDDISGAVIHLPEFQQGGPPNLPFAAFFQAQGFSTKQISDAAGTLQDWSSCGVTADLVKHVVALVDDRLKNQGNERPWSPKYYDREIRRRLNRESSGRSDAGAGQGGGDEIDSALGPLH